MVGIGMLFAARPSVEPNIEDTLLYASMEGMEGEDYRVLSILCTWLTLHARWVNADRLVRLVSAQSSPRIRLFWAAFAHWQKGDRRFTRLRKLHRGERQNLLGTGADFQLKRFGEDPRFKGSPLRVDARVLRDRVADVLTPNELAKRHSGYRWRLIIGPTYRADLWALLTKEPTLRVSEIARRAYASIGVAWEVRRDFGLVK
jgi:hypothetical protein